MYLNDLEVYIQNFGFILIVKQLEEEKTVIISKK